MAGFFILADTSLLNESQIQLQVEGMDCANCAQTITRSLQKNGLEKVSVNFASGEVRFEMISHADVDTAIEKIEELGYKVTERSDKKPEINLPEKQNQTVSFFPVRRRLIWSAVLTFPLLLHMFFSFGLLHNPYFQLLICTPVMLIGWNHFGKSAWNSVRAGFPNMDVLISIGSTAAYIYSIAGMILHYDSPEISNYLFFETAATIITLVLLGNLIEQRSVKKTTSAIHELSKLQPVFAKKISHERGIEEIIETPISQISIGDVLLVNSGDKIPVDGRVTEGSAYVNESLITGESMPVEKNSNDHVIGSTHLESGSIRMLAERVGENTTLAQIIRLVKDAQHSKPQIQKLGDKVSAIFVPAVVGISIITFILCFFVFDITISKSVMNSIAVLVVSCPCAMGLATPTAVMVGLGRAAQNGILIKGGQTLEQFSAIRTIVFDKTGTLTTGKFILKNFNVIEGDESEIKNIVYSIEKHSSHPLAISLKTELKPMISPDFHIVWKSIKEDKGIGINGTDEEGNLYSVGSYRMAEHLHTDNSHSIYVLKNNKLMATIDLEDEIRSGAHQTIRTLRQSGIRVLLISGDRKDICEKVGRNLGIDEVHSEQLPFQKLNLISELAAISPTAMVGDGMNDAPALAKANIGISLSSGTDIAMQSAQVILLQQKELHTLVSALSIGKKTYQTIKQNLFWAFFYNVLTIPIAAAGFLSPMIAALSMAFSDLVVIGNSLRLKYRKISS